MTDSFRITPMKLVYDTAMGLTPIKGVNFDCKPEEGDDVSTKVLQDLITYEGLTNINSTKKFKAKEGVKVGIFEEMQICPTQQELGHFYLNITENCCRALKS